MSDLLFNLVMFGLLWIGLFLALWWEWRQYKKLTLKRMKEYERELAEQRIEIFKLKKGQF